MEGDRNELVEPVPDGQQEVAEVNVPKVVEVVEGVQSETAHVTVEKQFRFVDRHRKSVCYVTGVGEPGIPVLGRPHLNSIDELRVQFDFVAEKIAFYFVHFFFGSFTRVAFDCGCLKSIN